MKVVAVIVGGAAEVAEKPDEEASKFYLGLLFLGPIYRPFELRRLIY